jgi:hypothetical protein
VVKEIKVIQHPMSDHPPKQGYYLVWEQNKKKQGWIWRGWIGGVWMTEAFDAKYHYWLEVPEKPKED